MNEVGKESIGLEALRSAGDQPLSPVARLRRLAALERGDLLVVFVYAAAAGLVSLATPIAAQSLVNTVAFTALLQPLIVLTVLVFLGLLVAGFTSTVQQTIIEKLHQRFFVRTVHDVAGRLLDADVAALPGRVAPDLTNRFFDVVIVQKAASTLLVDGLSALLQAAIALLLLAFYHPALLAFDLALLACIAFILFGLGRGGVDTAIKESKLKHQAGAWLMQIASSLSTFKGPDPSAFAFSRSDALAKSYVYARRKHFKVLLRQIVASHLLQALATAALLGLGGALVIQQQLSLGQLVAAEIAVTGVLASVAKSSKSLESYYDLVAALDKVGTLIDLPRERSGGLASTRRVEPGQVTLLDVAFAGEHGNPPLRRVSFSASPSSWLAVLGEDSDGRSTSVSLLYGVRNPSAGRLEIDGIDVRNWSLEELRRDVVLVADASFFGGTVYDNLHWGRAPVDAAYSADILALLDLADPVAQLPAGVFTPLSASAQPFTSDQVLRLTLARALASRPRLLLLDGTFDILGVAAARRISSGLRALCPGLTVIAFTRRPDIAELVGPVRRLTQGVLENAQEAA